MSCGEFIGDAGRAVEAVRDWRREFFPEGVVCRGLPSPAGPGAAEYTGKIDGVQPPPGRSGRFGKAYTPEP